MGKCFMVSQDNDEITAGCEEALAQDIPHTEKP
jgi:hypothetical protein